MPPKKQHHSKETEICYHTFGTQDDDELVHLITITHRVMGFICVPKKEFNGFVDFMKTVRRYKQALTIGQENTTFSFRPWDVKSVVTVRVSKDKIMTDQLKLKIVPWENEGAPISAEDRLNGNYFLIHSYVELSDDSKCPPGFIFMPCKEFTAYVDFLEEARKVKI